MALPNNPTQSEVVKAVKDLETNKADKNAVVTSVNGDSGTITNVAKTNADNSFSTAQTFNNNITLYKASGDSPRLTFQRGTLIDNYNDWSIYDTGGYLHIQQRGNASTDWEDRALFTTTGATLTGAITVGSIKKSGGTSSQFLKADGSVDSTSYQTALPTTTTAGKVLKSTSTAGTTEWGDMPSPVTESTVSGWGFTKNTGTITGVQLNGSTIASSGVANVQALPNFSLNISHQTAGNPRPVKFLTVNYNTAATYFKMSATSCHDNGTSYQFLEDIIIGCTTGGTVVCNVYKYCQQAVTYDGATRNYGDVFYVIDTTNKKVDFFILCGQYASSQFTPATKIGNTTIAYITQYTGTATYYSSGTKVWASGDSATYARTSDVPTSYVSSVNGQTGAVTVPSMPFTLTLVGTYTTVTAVNTIMTDTSWYLFVPYGTSVYYNMLIYNAATGSTNFQNGVPFFAHRESSRDYFYVGTLGATNSSAQQEATVYRVSYCKVYKVTF